MQRALLDFQTKAHSLCLSFLFWHGQSGCRRLRRQGFSALAIDQVFAFGAAMAMLGWDLRRSFLFFCMVSRVVRYVFSFSLFHNSRHHFATASETRR